jgi:hypothetical protein
MPGKSKHYQDVHFWILSVIKSCNSIYQLKVAENLIDNFQSYCKNYIDPEVSRRLVAELRFAMKMRFK